MKVFNITKIFIFLALFSMPTALFGATLKTDKYPRLANMFFRWDITESEARDLAKWDILIVDMEAQINSPQSLLLLKKLNPKIKLLAYLAPQEIRGDSGSLSGTLRQKFFQKINYEWWLRDSNGTKVAWWPTNPLINITDQAVEANRTKYSDVFSDFLRDEIISTGFWDGIFFDNVWDNVNFLADKKIDLNNDGKEESMEIVNQKWRAGMTEILQKTRQKIGANRLIIGNGGEYYYQNLHGVFYEHFPTKGWAQTMKKYSFIVKNGLSPTAGILNSNVNNSGQKNDYRKMRYGLASTLLFDGFFSFDNGDQSHREIWWYDEYELSLGDPLAPAKNISNSSQSLVEAVWRRDFSNGLVLLNSTNKKQKISLGGDYEKLLGQQDSATNNGGFISEVELNPFDGILLLRPVDKVSNALFANGSFVRVFNGFGHLARSGFFAYQKFLPGESKIWQDEQSLVVSLQNEIRIYDNNGVLLKKFLPFGENYAGKINFAIGDLSGNGDLEIVVAKEKESSFVKIFDWQGEEELPGFFAYSPNFQGGAGLALCDLNNDKKLEIVTGAGFGGGPHVRVFDFSGKVFDNGFFPFDKSSRSGINVACGDVDGDSQEEIVVGAPSGFAPKVKIYEARTHKVKKEFLAFEQENKSGVNVSIGDLDNDGNSEIVVFGNNVFDLLGF
ncbi:MAG: putative glycoside hydrolase [Patescibacteria group bacterium]